jgi:predicted nucleotide-binding protein (sugar kinase/HSP70/actin superfamily)
MPSAMGPCRFGQYSKFHRMLLDDLGLSNVPIVELDQASTNGYHGDCDRLGSRFRKLAWSGIILVDLLSKVCRQTRPYERSKGDCDALYQHYLARVENVVERGADRVQLAREMAMAFGGVAVDRRELKPRIGIIGEIYVRCNPHCNNFICQKLEALGAEVVLPPLEEWVDYIGCERMTDSLMAGKYTGVLVEFITGLIQDREVRRVTRPFKNVIRDFLYEAPTRELVALARPYLDFSVRGEAILSMARAVEYAHNGCDGVVNVVPFNCMPGTIVEALLERYRRFHPDMPILKMAYDGLVQVGEETRIEAFMYQTSQHVEVRTERLTHN